jgi:hypothetical protein
MDALLAAAAETGTVLTVPGLLNWLGRDHATNPDFITSVDDGHTESYEAYCTRTDEKEA